MNSDLVSQGLQLELTPGSRRRLSARGSELWRLQEFHDHRGSLLPLEHSEHLPFEAMRSFLVYGVPENVVRGEHAHRACKQLLIAAHGALTVVVDDGSSKQAVRLDDPAIGLFVPPMIWAHQLFERRAVLLVLASHGYDADDYIHDYAAFCSLAVKSNFSDN